MKTLHFGTTGPTAMIVTLLAAGTAAAHPATERYIPIGQSPGVSGKFSYRGEIESRDSRSIVVTDGRQRYTVTLPPQSRIWLDRSSLQQENVAGSYEDCRAGRNVEIKFADPATKSVAEWIKLQP